MNLKFVAVWAYKKFFQEILPFFHGFQPMKNYIGIMKWFAIICVSILGEKKAISCLDHLIQPTATKR